MIPRWIEWARQLQTIAQTGLSYPKSPYDVERYEAIREIAAEMMAAQTNVELGDVRSLFANEIGHTTPKVDVRGVVFRDDAILLVRERSDGCWTLPGGWADVGETPGDATVREIFEESGYRTRVVKVLALYDRDRHGHPPLAFHVYKLFFLCELIGGAPAESIETDGVDFFRADALPELSLTRVMPSQIQRFFEHARNPDWPTDFD
jgi:ADP-ribose pyrophosphatase YjhB (NUDIX family)